MPLCAAAHRASPFPSALSRAASCKALLKDGKAVVKLATDVLLQLTHLPAAESELWLPCLHVAEHSGRHTALITKQAVSAFRARPATISLYMQAARKWMCSHGLRQPGTPAANGRHMQQAGNLLLSIQDVAAAG